MPAKRKPTWIEVAVANGGFRQAIKAFSWAQSWIYVKVALGHDPTVDEVAEWWNQSRRSAFREQAAFRTCFPKLETPAPIYNTPEQIKQIERSVRNLEKVEAAVRRLKRPDDATILSEGLLNPGT